MSTEQAPPPSRRWRRKAALAAVVAGVLIGHALVTRGVMSQLEAMGPDAPSIKRMDAVMVADMSLSAPPIVAPPAAPPVPEPAAMAPDAVASAASEPASAPEDAADQDDAEEASPIASAASEPVSPAASDAVLVEADPTADAASTSASAASAPVAVAEAPDSAASDAEPFEWPLTTRVTFKAEGYIRGPIYGQAQVEWVREGMRYQVRVDASVGPSFAPLGSQRWTSEGEITPEGLAPRRFESINKLLISSGKPRLVTFHPHEVELSDGQRVPKLPMVQDPASHYIQLAYMALLKPETLQVGGTLSMPLAWTRKQDTVTYDILAREMLDTPVGKVETFKLKPRPLPSQKEKDKARDEVLAEIWVAPSLQYLPIRMLLRQGAANYLDMKMDKMPQQASAPSPEDARPARR
ncbi:MAG: DUF3108 domain-containing protein [Pseudomonadota bacterium]